MKEIIEVEKILKFGEVAEEEKQLKAEAIREAAEQMEYGEDYLICVSRQYQENGNDLGAKLKMAVFLKPLKSCKICEHEYHCSQDTYTDKDYCEKFEPDKTIEKLWCC